MSFILDTLVPTASVELVKGLQRLTKKVLLRLSGTSEERNVVSKETDCVAGKLRDTINLVAGIPGILKNSDTQDFDEK